jgi:hypothetical protein
VWRSLEIAVLPQLSLTLTNAVIVTASLSRELLPMTASVATERNLALSPVPGLDDFLKVAGESLGQSFGDFAGGA